MYSRCVGECRLVAGLPFGQVGAVELHFPQAQKASEPVHGILGEFSITGHLYGCSAGGLQAAEKILPVT